MNKILQFFQKVIVAFKLYISFLYVRLCGKGLKKKDIWLICEKLSEARDNGYHLYTYIRKNHPEIAAYYVIEKDSVDLCKIIPYGNIIYANTLKHFVYYLCALNSICSQPSGAAPEPKRVVKKLNLARKDQRVINLKHGITKDELSHDMDFSKTHYALLACASQIEQDFIVNTYQYPRSIAQNIGFCRFDNLINNDSQKKKEILIMPTFRKWLVSKRIPNEASESEKTEFLRSQYYCEYSKLLKNDTLIEFIKRKGYSLVFYPHYAAQPFIHCFDNCKSDAVIIADRYHYDVQQLLIESACLITDYSSIYFDFAYMEKPEIFFQFDEEQYRSTHYKKGYFDYRADGFGPVFEKNDQVISYLMKMIENDCELEKKYHDRITTFFDRRDNHNCERTFEAIMRIGQK